MCDKHTSDKALEQEITALVADLERTLAGPTYSYRLEEIRLIVAQLAACWTTYRLGTSSSRSGQDSLSLPTLSAAMRP